jgi:TonB family protein
MTAPFAATRLRACYGGVMRRLIVAVMLGLGISQAQGEPTGLCSFKNTTQLTPFSFCDGERCSSQKRWFSGCLTDQANFLLRVRGIEHTQGVKQSELLVGANPDCSPIIEVKVSGGDERDRLLIDVLKESFRALTPVGAKCDNFPMILKMCFGENCPRQGPVPPPNAIATAKPLANTGSTLASPKGARSETNIPDLTDWRTCKSLDEFYPRTSRELGEQGTVVLRYEVDKDGKLLQAVTETSSGYRRLDRAAHEFLKTCKFKITLVDGVPQDGSATISIIWKLD